MVDKLEENIGIVVQTTRSPTVWGESTVSRQLIADIWRKTHWFQELQRCVIGSDFNVGRRTELDVVLEDSHS